MSAWLPVRVVVKSPATYFFKIPSTSKTGFAHFFNLAFGKLTQKYSLIPQNPTQRGHEYFLSIL